MSILSIMIDEAGNLNMSASSNPLYCISLVFHNQDYDISGIISDFDEIQRLKGFNPDRAVHISPLIRKEPPYKDLNKADRKSLFTATAAFIQKLPIKYKIFIFDKTQTDTYNSFLAKMLSTIRGFLHENLSYFQQFEQIVIYYDKGQKEISSLFSASFGSAFPNTEMRVAYQNDYKLLQVADYICTLEYTKQKWDLNRETKSEIDFFGSRRIFIRNYYNNLKKFVFKTASN